MMLEDNVLGAEVQELLQAAGVEVAYAPDKQGMYRWVGPGGRSGEGDTRFGAAQDALAALRRLAEAHPAPAAGR